MLLVISNANHHHCTRLYVPARCLPRSATNDRDRPVWPLPLGKLTVHLVGPYPGTVSSPCAQTQGREKDVLNLPQLDLAIVAKMWRKPCGGSQQTGVPVALVAFAEMKRDVYRVIILAGELTSEADRKLLPLIIGIQLRR